MALQNLLALHVLLTGTSKTYWHSMSYLPALHACNILTGTPLITTGIPTIHMQLLNLIIIYLSLAKLMAFQLSSACIK